MLNFVFLEKGLGIISPPHVANNFSRKMFLMLYSINWPTLIVWFAFTSWDIEQHVHCNYLFPTIVLLQPVTLPIFNIVCKYFRKFLGASFHVVTLPMCCNTERGAREVWFISAKWTIPNLSWSQKFVWNIVTKHEQLT